ncbi:DUF1800 domain-containing protein [Mucilaginibacter limnophilus]|uniref:DUF1800 domain-containing protein n=1 Tax=Mucilaginibacter limnophilus TaxID=1932778 RepID=A0A3S2UKE5_9SPHI|nr:DUF1800 domain-containing protein [Mucilaginibacter limnophilus]RVT99762.1 DUF1800 domain-containing protein [Mucilaginibacter limnophilus]
MKVSVKKKCFAVAILIIFASSSSFDINHRAVNYATKFPFQSAGLNERQAAVHLLSRFTYGVTTDQIDAVVKTGLEDWFKQQLNGNLPDDSLNHLISNMDAVVMTNTQLITKYPRMSQIIKLAVRDGVIEKDLIKADNVKSRALLLNYLHQKDMGTQQELFQQFISQKILRAAYSQNQLQEVMTDFWFNHFNVSITKGQCAIFIPAYERDVIRPNALGKFKTLLIATAKSPAMLLYLDNFSSSSSNITDIKPISNRKRKELVAGLDKKLDTVDSKKINEYKNLKPQNVRGLNENYAREVMELHTLGVAGGYTQRDVTQAALILTGWTIYPIGDEANSNGIRRLMNGLRPEQLDNEGYVHDGDFLFTPSRHDKGKKNVLGEQFGPDNGYQEGIKLLTMLAGHSSTAKFICKKLAIRFVSDNPPKTLINRMATTFKLKDGDIKEVLLTMVSSPEFWSTNSVRQKIKSPFELAIGATRTLNAKIIQPYQLYSWISKMGEKRYYYQAPTGFPDKGNYWINAGSLLTRMNFSIALASNRIPGVKVDLPALNNYHEFGNQQNALIHYSKIILPERNLSETIKRITPILNNSQFTRKVEQRNPIMIKSEIQSKATGHTIYENAEAKKNKDIQPNAGNNSILSELVGLILGSPEYQRR